MIDARRRAARLGRAAAGRRSGSCIEGDEEIGSARCRPTRRRPRAVSRRRDGHRRHGRVAPGMPTLTIALRGMADVDRRGPDAGPAEAQRPVRRRGAGRADRADRRARERCTTRAGTSPSPACAARSGTGLVQRGGVPRARRVRRRLPLFGTGGLGVARLVGPGDDGDGHRRAAGRRRASTRSSPYARAKLNMRMHPEQDAVEAQEAVVAHLAGQRPFGIDARVTPAGTGNGLRGDHRRPRLRGGARGVATAWGSEKVVVAAAAGRSRSSARCGGAARRRDAAGRHHRRLRQHPRSERARAAGRVRARRVRPRRTFFGALRRGPRTRAGA